MAFEDRPAAIGFFVLSFLRERPGATFLLEFKAVEGDVISNLKRAGHIVETYRLKGMEFGETLRAILATERGDLRYFGRGESSTGQGDG